MNAVDTQAPPLGGEAAQATSLTTLVRGIANDAEHLIDQQFTLIRRELQLQLQRVRMAAVSFGLAAGLVAVGAIFLLFTIVHALHEAGLPLWLSYLIVGGVLAGAGLIFFLFGKKEAEDVQILPPQSTQALKENLEWLKNPTTSNPR